MSNFRRPADKHVSDALREINKKLEELIKNVNSIVVRLETGDVDFT